MFETKEVMGRCTKGT